MAVLDLSFTSARSERLLLRKAVSDDLAAYVELCSDPDVQRYLGGPVPAEQVRARAEFRGVASITEDPGAFIVAEPATGELLGTVMLERRPTHRPGHVNEGADELELSYLLRHKWWGQGLALEAASLLLRTTADDLPDQVVLVITQTANKSSLALAKRIGFEHLDTFTEINAEQWLGGGQLHKLGTSSVAQLPTHALE